MNLHRLSINFRLFLILFVSVLVALLLYIYILAWETHSVHHIYKRDKVWKKLNMSDAVTTSEVANNLSEEYPNVPFDYWLKRKKDISSMFYKNNTCARFPDILKLNINNRFWQSVYMSNKTTAQLYNAFYDVRRPDSNNVKIIGMVNKLSDVFPGKNTYHCQLWFEDEKEPVISKMGTVYYVWYQAWYTQVDGMLGPYIITCPIPKSHQEKVPKVVSLVENPCDCTNNMLHVIYEVPTEQKEFAVCIKGLDFLQTDLSVRLVEWIEVLLFMGADKIFFYKYDLHPRIQKVLDYYKQLGKVVIKETSLPPGDPDIPLLKHFFIEGKLSDKRLIELIPYNDCFYNNIYSYKYVLLMDIDEVIVPTKDKNWHELMARIQARIKPGQRFGSYNARNVYFLDEMKPEGVYKSIPPYMHMLQHIYRSKIFNKPGWYVKSFFDTNQTISCHNHLPIATFGGALNSYTIELEDAYMHHYRHSCVQELNCDDYMKDPIRDTRLWHFKDDLIKNVNKVFDDLNFFQT